MESIFDEFEPRRIPAGHDGRDERIRQEIVTRKHTLGVKACLSRSNLSWFTLRD